jgi:activating signal cointegrator complex subunit 1
LNTVYVPGVRARDGKGGHGRNKARLTIDATEIIEDWADREWMSQVKIEKVAICRMGAKTTDDGGEEYVVEEEVELP